MRYKSLFTRKTIVVAIIISAILCFTFPMIAGAETEVRFTTNGAANNYAPGSVMIVYGRWRITASEYPLPVFWWKAIGGRKFISASQ